MVVLVFGTSMEPTLHHEDKVLIWKPLGPWLPKRDEIVPADIQRVASIPEPKQHTVIKRVKGLPGDRLKTYLKDVHYRVQEQVAHLYREQGERTWLVPQGHCFLMGDGTGTDSRVWGAIPHSALLGRVILHLKTGKKRATPAEVRP